MKTHDLRHLSMREAYDHTQTSDDVKDGDILIVQDGVAIQHLAWPTMVMGLSDVFHKMGGDWEAFDGGSYADPYRRAVRLYAEVVQPALETAQSIQRHQQDFSTTLAVARLTDDQLSNAARRMQRDGGGFVRCIAEAFIRSDNANSKRILGQFGAEFLRYATAD